MTFETVDGSLPASGEGPTINCSHKKLWATNKSVLHDRCLPKDSDDI